MSGQIAPLLVRQLNSCRQRILLIFAVVTQPTVYDVKPIASNRVKSLKGLLWLTVRATTRVGEDLNFRFISCPLQRIAVQIND